jgi:taurine dioxygenase
MIDVGPRVAARTPEGFDDRPYERFAILPLTPTIGAEVDGVDLARPLDDELRSELRRALLEWKVLFFRDQDISRDDQRSFAEQWGELEQHPFYKLVQHGEQERDVDVVRLAKGDANPGFENEWHHDVTWRAAPSFGAVLRAVEIPAVGGDTLWADCAAAYDGLPAELREQIAGLEAEHDWRHNFGLAIGAEQFAELAATYPPAVHPVVRRHPETGRATLFVNTIFTTRVLGLEPAESEALLARLFAEYRRPEYQCRFRWQPGSVAFWDNRATVHYAASDYHPARRVMDRISIAGDVPVGLCPPPAARSSTTVGGIGPPGP